VQRTTTTYSATNSTSDFGNNYWGSFNVLFENYVSAFTFEYNFGQRTTSSQATTNSNRGTNCSFTFESSGSNRLHSNLRHRQETPTGSFSFTNQEGNDCFAFNTYFNVHSKGETHFKFNSKGSDFTNSEKHF
jgi:hypothetical protein